MDPDLSQMLLTWSVTLLQPLTSSKPLSPSVKWKDWLISSQEQLLETIQKLEAIMRHQLVILKTAGKFY